mgnify:CR=1 FL=1
MEKKRNKENMMQILEYAYLVTFAFFIAMGFLGTTMFEIEWPSYFYKDLRAILLIIVILRMGCGCTFNKKEILLIGCIGITILCCVNRKGYDIFYNILLLIIGCKGISGKKIIRTYLIITGALLAITILAALSGKIENLVYYQGARRRRISMGIKYPTDFSAHVFFIILSYIYVRGKRITYLELASIIPIGGIVYWLTDARLNTACILMASIILIIHKYWTEKKMYSLKPLWTTLLAMAPIWCAAFMIIVSLLYSSDNRLMVIFNKILNNRFIQSHKAIEVFGFTMLGKNIPMQGYGSTIELPKHYFYLDSSYINILMRYGAILFIVVLFIWILISFQARENKDWILLWLIVIISIQCMIEHHMIELSYNPFILLLLTRESVYTNSPSKKEEGK